jgi:hypothetical protein
MRLLDQLGFVTSGAQVIHLDDTESEGEESEGGEESGEEESGEEEESGGEESGGRKRGARASGVQRVLRPHPDITAALTVRWFGASPLRAPSIYLTCPPADRQVWNERLVGKISNLLSPAFVDGGAGPYRGRQAALTAHLAQAALSAKDDEVDFWAVVHTLWLQG